MNGNLTIDSAGIIDVSVKGLKGGANGSIFGNKGETYDNQENIVAGTDNDLELGSGGSYGGKGSWSWADNQIKTLVNQPYGLLEDPIWLGAGGSGLPGGNGGGKIYINAVQVILNGTLKANGQDGTEGGGGSGGSVKIEVGTLSGTGLIQSKGGSAGHGAPACCILSGAGSGGRITIYYDELSLPEENIQAFGGEKIGDISTSGAAGTIYLKKTSDTNGKLLLNNGNIPTNQETPLSFSNLKYLKFIKNHQFSQRGN